MEPNLVSDPMTAFPDFAPQRVVSLVPSVTASLFELGLGHTLAGVTTFCNEPANGVAGLPKLGGPKDPEVEAILRLRPDLVIANREENSREALEALAQAGLVVWLAFPLTVRAALADLWTTASLFRNDLALERVRFLEKSVEWAEMAAIDQTPVRYFCPVWQDTLASGQHWWMTFNDQTYSADLLRLFNGVNIFGARSRRYPLLAEFGQAQPEEPGQRDTRYPRVSIEEICEAAPEVVLLPSEPYAYSDADRDTWLDLLSGTPAGQSGRIYLVEGSLLTWPGTRLARALEELPQYLTV